MITILDNFYENPKNIVDILNGEYPISGCGTGNRSIPLEHMNQKFYREFCDYIIYLHKLDSSKVNIISFFMEHESHPIEVFNKKWIHMDGKNPDVCMMTMEEYRLLVCGQIFLSENPDPEAGVKICELKPEVNWTEKQLIENCIDNYTQPRVDYDRGIIDLEEFTRKHTSYHNNFNLTIDIKNKYNRMVSWKAGTLHGDPITSNMSKRLTQYFFVEKR